MKDLINRVATALGQRGVSKTDIHDMLIEEGMSEYEAFLTYIGGKMLYESRKGDPRTSVTVRHMKRVIP